MREVIAQKHPHALAQLVTVPVVVMVDNVNVINDVDCDDDDDNDDDHTQISSFFKIMFCNVYLTLYKPPCNIN